MNMDQENTMATRYEREIPEGYEARIEGNKVIIELKESEDERIRRALIEVFKKKLEKGFEWVEYGIPNRSVLNWLEKQKEQKPAEWSEEDERMLCKCISATFDHGYLRECNWLKSLRPQPHWKPSEEQMDALKYALGEGGKFDKDALESLYNDLKQL